MPRNSCSIPRNTWTMLRNTWIISRSSWPILEILGQCQCQCLEILGNCLEIPGQSPEIPSNAQKFLAYSSRNTWPILNVNALKYLFNFGQFSCLDLFQRVNLSPGHQLISGILCNGSASTTSNLKAHLNLECEMLFANRFISALLCRVWPECWIKWKILHPWRLP